MQHAVVCADIDHRRTGLVFDRERGIPGVGALRVTLVGWPDVDGPGVDDVAEKLFTDQGVESAAELADLLAAHENAAIHEVIDRWLAKSALPVIAYSDYQAGIAAEGS